MNVPQPQFTVPMMQMQGMPGQQQQWPGMSPNGNQEKK